MKKILFILTILLITFWRLSAATITSIKGDENICPLSSTTYTVNYTLIPFNPLGAPIYEQVTSVKWEFIHNGIVLKTLNSSNFMPITPTGLGSAKITIGPQPTGEIGGGIGWLPLGGVKIKVTLYYIYRNPYMPYPQVSIQKSIDINVGLADAGIINGDAICPNSPGTFSIAAIDNATSYTWEVPPGWKINGVTGPVVANLGTSVTVTPCSDPLCAPQPLRSFVIKVKGVSTTCGIGMYKIKTITIDYPIKITETNVGSNNVKLSATPSDLPNYKWTLDPAWYFPTTGSKNLPDISFNSRGITGLAKLTYTTHCQNTYTRDWWWVPPAQPGDPGWTGDPQDPDPGDCEPEIPMNPSAKSGNVIYLKDPCGDEPPLVSLYANNTMKRVTLTKSFDGYEYDISELSAGAYIMRVKTARGKYKTVKFIKLD